MKSDSNNTSPALDNADAIPLYIFSQGLLSLRRWERRFVPFSSPQIALDIALFATAARLDKRFITSKSVHLTVGHSADRVREVLAELVCDGWIAKTRHPNDKRIRVIEATDKLVYLMSEYERCARAQLSECASGFSAPYLKQHVCLPPG